MAMRKSKQAKRDMLAELHGEEGFEEMADGKFMIDGERAYILDPTRSLNVRHELLADLAATGMKPAEIARLIKTNGSKSDGGYYATLLRDPRIRSRARSEIADVVDTAKENIRNVVVKASENIALAVNAGDVKLSQYVLATQGLTDKQPAVSPSVHLDFGSWLGTIQNTKQVHDITGNTAARKIISDESALPAPEGITLDM
jgi:hypothetical protein